jgi:hypothetical protein
VTLHAFLIAWSWFSHTLFEVWTSGAPDHVTHPIYEGNGPACLSIAHQTGDRVVGLDLLQVYP